MEKKSPAPVVTPVRITHKDIAEKLGVHRTTVSMALRKNPRIPEETRQKVEQLAIDMGYVPDPMLSALSAYRSSRRPAAFQGVLAWVINSSGNYKSFMAYHDGVEAGARRHGFLVETMDLNGTGMTPGRLARSMRARSISGLLLCPQPRPHVTLDFPWEDFSAVTFGYTLESPLLHTIVPAQYRNLTRVMRELSHRGYRRIGLVLHAKHDARTDHNYLGAWYSERHFLPVRLDPLLYENHHDYKEPLRAWLRKWRPDAIIAGLNSIIPNLQSLGLSIPDDIAVACPGLGDTDTNISGMREESFHVGEVAADFLVAMMQRGERGIPVHQQRIHVEGSWVEGSTIRPLS